MDGYVIKRNGQKQPVSFDKVLTRINKLSTGLSNIDIIELCKNIIHKVNNGVTTSALDNFAAKHCHSLTKIHPEYEELAKRITVSDLHKSTPDDFKIVTEKLFESSIVTEEYFNFVKEHSVELNKVLNYENDYQLSYFGVSTLKTSYLAKSHNDNSIIERPQHLLMRVAVGLWYGENNIENVLQTYDILSKRYYTHGTPTLYNCGTKRPQCSSCFLLGIEDSIDGIYDTHHKLAQISKHSGGIGFHVSNVRCEGSYIKGINGTCNGIVRMLKVFEATSCYVDQGSKRPGSFCVYLEPWHGDIEVFVEMRRNNGKEEERARQLFYALWIPDLFMERVKNNEMWTLMCPNTCKGLTDCHGKRFEELYTFYEQQEHMIKKRIPARNLWYKILNTQIETGMPFMLYKDHVNHKSSLQDFGTIKSSNLCTEIVQHSNYNEEVAVCNLASVCLPIALGKELNFTRLQDVVRRVVRNNNRVIDINYYPVKEASYSNKYHRPMGIGIQGLADLFLMLHLPFDSVEANKLNARIFENMYYAALDESSNIAIEKQTTFPSYEFSMYKKGILQFHMWNHTEFTLEWEPLIEKIKKHGVYNSQLIAPMPTASTSQIMGFTESFEPITSNLYTRQTKAGEFIIINKFMVEDLQKLGLWNHKTREIIDKDGGSIQNVPGVPDDIKLLYRTVWEIKQKSVIDLAASRGPFVDQSQSMNLYMANPDQNRMTKMHFYAWEKGLKTGMYYLRTKSASQAQKVSVSPELLEPCAEGFCTA